MLPRSWCRSRPAGPRPEAIWINFLRKLTRRGLRGVKLVVSAFIAKAFAQDKPEAASPQCRYMAEKIRPKVPKLDSLMGNVEEDMLAYMTLPKQHRAKLSSTNATERLNDDAIVKLVGALLLEQHDKWAITLHDT